MAANGIKKPANERNEQVYNFTIHFMTIELQCIRIAFNNKIIPLSPSLKIRTV